MKTFSLAVAVAVGVMMAAPAEAARADDGHIDAAERAKIERHQDRLNRRLSVQKHDGQSR